MNRFLSNFSLIFGAGTASEEQMKEEVKALDKVTHNATVKGSEIALLSTEDEQPDRDSVRCALLSCDYVREFEKCGSVQDLSIPKSFLGDELKDEVIKGSHLLAVVDSQTMAVDSAAVWSIAQRCGVSGLALQTPSKARNLFLAEALTSGTAGKGNVTVLYRKDDAADIKKAYAFFGSQYRYTPQSRVFDIIKKTEEELAEGAFEFDGGSITPYLTRASYRIPYEERTVVDAFGRTVADGVEKLGIEAINSDTGESSMTFLGYYINSKGRKCYAGEASAKHTKELTTAFMSKKIMSEVFPLLKEVPDNMLKLASCEEERSLEDFKKVLDMFVKKNMRRVTGEHRNAFVEATAKEYSDAACWTMYDTALELMSIPDIIGSKAWDCDADLRKDAGRIPALLVKYAGLA